MNKSGLIHLSSQVVKPEWIDYNGHMNIAYYTMAFDIALDALLSDHLGMDIEFIQAHKVGPFALQIHYVYLSELHQGEPFEVYGRILDHDQKRMHLFQQIEKPSDGSLVATSESLSMNVDHTTRKSAPYPDFVQEKIRETYTLTSNQPLPPQVGQALGIRR